MTNMLMNVIHIIYIKRFICLPMVVMCIIISLYDSVSKPVGLVNLGQSCYMNSVLQVLYHTKALKEYFQDINHEDGKILSNAFYDFLVEYDQKKRKKTKCFKPERIHRQMKDISEYYASEETYGNGLPHSAHEFFNFVLEKLIEEQKGIEEDKKVQIGDLFKIVVCSTKQFCQHELERRETGNWFYLDLTVLEDEMKKIKKKRKGCCANCCKKYDLDVKKLIEWYVAPQRLDYGGYGCKKCQKEKAYIRQEKSNIMSTSKYLILAISAIPRVLQKQYNSIFTAPMQLDMAEYLSNNNNENDKNDEKSTKYNLYGVIRHIGFGTYSHYESVVKDGDKWFLCDNNNVTQISKPIETKIDDTHVENDLNNNSQVVSYDILSRKYSDVGVVFLYERVDEQN